MKELIQLLNSMYPLSPELERHLLAIATYHSLRKGEFLLREGQTCSRITYLQQGLIRSYYHIRDEEISNWFMKERDLCISVLSFFRQIPTRENIIALEECECYSITHAQLEQAYRAYPEFNIHGRLIASEYYCRSEERHQDIRRQTAADKYGNLLANDPDLLSRVPIKDLASFLNVSDRTLSKIRKHFREKDKKSS